MSLSINTAAPVATQTTTSVARNPAERQAFRDLAQALKASDLTAARQAYVAILKNAPEGAQFPRGSAFADVGRALAQGDVAGATAAFKSMVQGRLDGRPQQPPAPVPLPPQASAGPNSLLDVVA